MENERIAELLRRLDNRRRAPLAGPRAFVLPLSPDARR